MLTNAKHTLAHVTYTPLVLTHADRTCALANLDILEIDAIASFRHVWLLDEKAKACFKRATQM